MKKVYIRGILKEHMMNKEFLKKIENVEFGVYFFASKMSVPFIFALHTWVVVVSGGKTNRFDVWGSVARCGTSWGHLHKNLYRPTLGVRVLPLKGSDPYALRFQGTLLYGLEGGKGSLAERVVNFMGNVEKVYPYLDTYHYYPGPNSNTFTAWVIEQFPEMNFRLPWNAIGKNYIIKSIA